MLMKKDNGHLPSNNRDKLAENWAVKAHAWLRGEHFHGEVVGVEPEQPPPLRRRNTFVAMAYVVRKKTFRLYTFDADAIVSMLSGQALLKVIASGKERAEDVEEAEDGEDELEGDDLEMELEEEEEDSMLVDDQEHEDELGAAGVLAEALRDPLRQHKLSESLAAAAGRQVLRFSMEGCTCSECTPEFHKRGRSGDVAVIDLKVEVGMEGKLTRLLEEFIKKEQEHGIKTKLNFDVFLVKMFSWRPPHSRKRMVEVLYGRNNAAGGGPSFEPLVSSSSGHAEAQPLRQALELARVHAKEDFRDDGMAVSMPSCGGCVRNIVDYRRQLEVVLGARGRLPPLLVVYGMANRVYDEAMVRLADRRVVVASVKHCGLLGATADKPFMLMPQPGGVLVKVPDIGSSALQGPRLLHMEQSARCPSSASASELQLLAVRRALLSREFLAVLRVPIKARHAAITVDILASLLYEARGINRAQLRRLDGRDLVEKLFLSPRAAKDLAIDLAMLAGLDTDPAISKMTGPLLKVGVLVSKVVKGQSADEDMDVGDTLVHFQPFTARAWDPSGSSSWPAQSRTPHPPKTGEQVCPLRERERERERETERERVVSGSLGGCVCVCVCACLSE